MSGLLCRGKSARSTGPQPLAFVDPQPVIPHLVAVPEFEITPRPDDWWPFSRFTEWRPLFGPIQKDADPSAVPVAVVPEPGTWALMLGGLGWVVWVTRRRNVMVSGPL
jgi:hypothetical protein